MKSGLLTVAAIFFASATASAQSCPDLSGTYVHFGETLIVEQTDCTSLVTKVSDGYLTVDLKSEYFPNQGPYADPRFDRHSNAVRVDSFDSGYFVSETQFNDGATVHPRRIKMQIHLDQSTRTLIVEHFEFNGTTWSLSNTCTWNKQ